MTSFACMLSKGFRLALLAPAAYWFYLIFTGGVGADPAKTLNHATGQVALYFLLGNLLLGVLLAFSVRLPKALRFLLASRRFLGVVTFLYLVAHVFLYLAMEGFAPQAFTQLYTKWYLTVGFSAWLILLVLALTSNNVSVRLLGGRRWKNVHRAVYLAAFLVTAHVLSIEKADLVKYGILFALLWLAEGARALRAVSLWAKKRFGFNVPPK